MASTLGLKVWQTLMMWDLGMAAHSCSMKDFRSLTLAWGLAQALLSTQPQMP